MSLNTAINTAGQNQNKAKGQSPVSQWTSNLTDFLGLTDTQAPQRGLEALEGGANTASQTLEQRMAPVNEMYLGAMQGRDMGDVLDWYHINMMGTEDAAGADNVQNFLNPQYGRAVSNAANQALAGAGAGLQSSAANAAVGSAVGNQVSNMWQQAFQNAMADAGNKQGIYGNVAQSDLMPSANWAQLTADLAGTEYTKGMDLAAAKGAVGGQDTSWFGNLF